MIKISIVTTCFNAESTIAETIESIQANKGDFIIEHIITDAGSKDRTIEIIKKYGDIITLYETPGLNQSQGINYGLKKATGQIVTFLNADDLYYPDTLQNVVNAFNDNPDKLWLAGQCQIIDEHGNEQTNWISSYKNFWLKFYSYFWLLVENYICQPAVFFKKEVFSKYGYFSESENYCMDYEFWLRIGYADKPIVLNRDLAKFRRMQNTKSNSGFEKQFLDDYRLGLSYSKLNGYFLTRILKVISYYRTILIYRRLYG